MLHGFSKKIKKITFDYVLIHLRIHTKPSSCKIVTFAYECQGCGVKAQTVKSLQGGAGGLSQRGSGSPGVPPGGQGGARGTTREAPA